MSELAPGENHPACEIAKRIVAERIAQMGGFILLESLSSCAIEGNRLSEICADTLDRVMTGKPVGERYLMGLALMLIEMERIKP